VEPYCVGVPRGLGQWFVTIEGSTVFQTGNKGVRAVALESGKLLCAAPVSEQVSHVRKVIPHRDGFLLWGGGVLQDHDYPGGAPRWRKLVDREQDVLPFDEKSIVAIVDGSVVRVSIENG